MTCFGILSLRPQFEQRMVPTGKGGGRGGGGAGGEGAGVEGAGGKGAGGPADATNPLPQTPKSKKRKKTVNDDDDGDSDGDYQAPGTPKKPRRQRASKRLASNAKVVNPDDEDEFVQIQSPIPRKRAAGEDSSETEGAPAQPPRKRPARIAAAAKKPPSRRKNAQLRRQTRMTKKKTPQLVRLPKARRRTTPDGQRSVGWYIRWESETNDCQIFYNGADFAEGGPFDFLHPGYPTPIVIDGLDAADHVWSNANQLFHYGMTFFQAMAPAKQTSKCAISGTPVSSKTLPLVLKALKVVSTQEARNSKKSAHHVSEETFDDVANSFRQLKIDDPVWKNQCHETDPVGLVLCGEMQLTFASHHQEEQKGDINLQLRQIEKQRDRIAGDSQSLANDARADKATIARHKGTIEQHSQELVTLAEKMQGIARRGREREQQLSTDLSQLRDDRTVYITTADCMSLMGT